MDSMLKTIFPCFTGRDGAIKLPNNPSPAFTASEKAALHDRNNDQVARLTHEEAAARIIIILFSAKKGCTHLSNHVNNIAHAAGGWSQYLANKVREGMEAALKAGKKMSPVMAAAYDKAVEAAKVFEQFAEDHPLATAVFLTVIAIGVLVILAPYVLELLGFGELGPIEGK